MAEEEAIETIIGINPIVSFIIKVARATSKTADKRNLQEIIEEAITIKEGKAIIKITPIKTIHKDNKEDSNKKTMIYSSNFARIFI